MCAHGGANKSCTHALFGLKTAGQSTYSYFAVSGASQWNPPAATTAVLRTRTVRRRVRFSSRSASSPTRFSARSSRKHASMVRQIGLWTAGVVASGALTGRTPMSLGVASGALPADRATTTGTASSICCGISRGRKSGWIYTPRTGGGRPACCDGKSSVGNNGALLRTA